MYSLEAPCQGASNDFHKICCFFCREITAVSLTLLTLGASRQSRRVVLYVLYIPFLPKVFGHLTILLLNFEEVHSATSKCVKNIAVCMTNRVDPDQMPHSAASDLGLHCLQRPICPNTQGNFGKSCANLSKVAGENCLSRRGTLEIRKISALFC